MTKDNVGAAPTTPPKATSPSKNIQRAIDESWHPEGTTDPKQALKDKHTDHPVSTDGGKK